MTKVEKYIHDYTRACSNELVAIEDANGKKVVSYREWLTPENAFSVAEIAKEETLDKVCKWLEENLHMYNTSECKGDRIAFVEDFKKAMEE